MNIDNILPRRIRCRQLVLSVAVAASAADQEAVRQLTAPDIACGAILARSIRPPGAAEPLRRLFLLRRDDGTPLGCFGIDMQGDYWELQALCIGQQYRGLGIGSEVVRCLIEAARRHARILIAMSKSAHDWFEKFGFVNEPYAFLPQPRRALVDPGRASRLMVHYPEQAGGGAGTFRIRLTRSTRQFLYDPTHDISILDAAARQDIRMDSLCSAGVCGTCSTRILTGETRHFVEQVTPPHAGHILPCISEPLSNVILDA